MSNFDKESRLWAIAINAIREARIAVWRQDDPFSDDDSNRVVSIYQLLHVHENSSVETGHQEHHPLVGKVEISDQAARVADALRTLPEELRPVEVKVPAKTHPKSAA
jgi:hypothetical protein